jgi:hypothetical protein
MNHEFLELLGVLAGLSEMSWTCWMSTNGMLRASPAGWCIASARVWIGLIGPTRRLRTSQRGDTFGLTCPVWRIGPPNLGHRCVGADRRAVRPCPPAWPRMAATQRAKAMVVKGSVVSPVASLYAAALATCCAAQRMAWSLQCWRLGLRAGIQCHQVFLNRSCPISSCIPTDTSQTYL